MKSLQNNGEKSLSFIHRLLFHMSVVFLYVPYGLSNDPRNGVHDPNDFWAILLITIGLFAFILGLSNWRLGLWLIKYNVRLLNIVSGLLAIILGILILFG